LESRKEEAVNKLKPCPRYRAVNDWEEWPDGAFVRYEDYEEAAERATAYERTSLQNCRIADQETARADAAERRAEKANQLYHHWRARAGSEKNRAEALEAECRQARALLQYVLDCDMAEQDWDAYRLQDFLTPPEAQGRRGKP
jgi:hypothetical protein